MNSHNPNRRTMLAMIGASGLIGPACAQRAAPSDMLDVTSLGADPSGSADSAPAFQRAIDQLAPSGGTIYVPAGRYRIDRTLVWANADNARKPGIWIQGQGLPNTVLTSTIKSGPLLRVRGVRRQGPVNTTYFWGGGLRDLTFAGSNASPDQHGLDVLGWYYGEIVNCNFQNFGGDAIRASVDPQVDPNPDWTSSTLFLRGVWVERVGGWGFRDMSDNQGAPAWSFDRCNFTFCGAGGALVKSGGLSFTKCSFAVCGWPSERAAAAATAYGLYFDGASTACSQITVDGCEFDSNLTAHIGARFLSASSFLNNRFIFSDRIVSGRITPPIGVEIGSGDANAGVFAVQFRQSFFRIDRAGSAVGFDFRNSANVRDVDISGSLFSHPPAARVIRYRGQDPGGQGRAFGYRISDQTG